MAALFLPPNFFLWLQRFLSRLSQRIIQPNEQASIGGGKPLFRLRIGSHFAMSSSKPSHPATESRNYIMYLAKKEASTDEVAIIFCFLPPKDIMCARVCTTLRDTAKKALVPLTPFELIARDLTTNAVRAMSSHCTANISHSLTTIVTIENNNFLRVSLSYEFVALRFFRVPQPIVFHFYREFAFATLLA